VSSKDKPIIYEIAVQIDGGRPYSAMAYGDKDFLCKLIGRNCLRYGSFVDISEGGYSNYEWYVTYNRGTPLTVDLWFWPHSGAIPEGFTLNHFLQSSKSEKTIESKPVTPPPPPPEPDHPSILAMVTAGVLTKSA
jgi:hypothetical protein